METLTVQCSTPDDDAKADRSAGGVLTIDLEALRANYRWLARQVAPAVCGAVVKADGYGLGADLVGPTLQQAGCRDFFVAHLAEALALQPHLAEDATVFILNGLQPGAEPDCAGTGLVPVLNSLAQVEAWSAMASACGIRLPAAVQVDSGMSRLGLSPDEWRTLAHQPARLGRLDVQLVMSHLACADEPDHPMNAAQWAAFEAARRVFPGARTSLANSGGVLLDRRYHHDLARPGLALYGVSPIAGWAKDLRPVVRLAARVIQVRSIPAGTAVGYGATFTAAAPTRLATVAVGYADGWPRHLGNVGAAFHDGVRLPIVGRVSMDSTILDVSALPEGALTLGSTVELLGPHQSLDDVAAQSGTIAYEILTRLGRRYARRIIGADQLKPVAG